MSVWRTPHIGQRALRVLLAVSVALVLPVSASASGQVPYDHRWQLEGLLTGDVGATAHTDTQLFTVRVTGVTAPAPAPATLPTTRPAGTSPAPADQPAAPEVSPIDYIVRGLTGRRSLTPVPAASEQVRAARALRDAAVPNVAVLPADAIAMDLDVAGTYLDAKNRATGLLGDSGPTGDYVAYARVAAAAARAAVPGRPAPGADADAGAAYARDLVRLLAPQVAGVAGARALSDDAASIKPGAPAATVARLRLWLAVAEALAADKPFGSVIAPAAESAKAVAQGRLPQTGALADAVLAAADSPKAPVEALVVTDFARAPYADVSTLTTASTNGATPSGAPASEPASAGVNALPREVLARAALGSASDGAPPAITYDAGGQQRVAPATWLAYIRADGMRFWLAGAEGPVALTDASLRGWAWSARRAALVDATRVGRTLALFDLR